jgi:dTDP-4-dehydrorhamnose 3,5-epimerase
MKKLTKRVEEALGFEDYRTSGSIAGVRERRLTKHRSTAGWFMELMRLGDDHTVAEMTDERFAPRQCSIASAGPDRVNAFHIHVKRDQDELWTVIQGQLLVWLVDCRAGSPTEGVRQKFILSGEQPAQLLVPAGVAHGYRAGKDGALLVYVMNQQFDNDDPDEGRLPWDFFGAELWKEDRG